MSDQDTTDLSGLHDGPELGRNQHETPDGVPTHCPPDILVASSAEQEQPTPTDWYEGMTEKHYELAVNRKVLAERERMREWCARACEACAEPGSALIVDVTTDCAATIRGKPRSEAPEALPQFNDPRVKMVYEILADTDESANPPEGEHWEGWTARRIVQALETDREALLATVGSLTRQLNEVNTDRSRWIQRSDKTWNDKLSTKQERERCAVFCESEARRYATESGQQPKGSLRAIECLGKSIALEDTARELRLGPISDLPKGGL